MLKKPSGLSGLKIDVGTLDSGVPTFDVERSLRKVKSPRLTDVGTPESRIGTPISSTDSDNDFGNSPFRTFSYPYTELLNEEISTRPTARYLEIKSHSDSVTKHSRFLKEDGIRGKLRYSMETYKHPGPELTVILKEYTFETTSQSLESLLLVKLFEEKIFKEIYLQQKAEQIARKNKKEQCRVNIPLIIEFGKFSVGYTTHFYIIMEFIEGVSPVTLEDCKSLKTRVEAIDKCLQEEGVFHNDLNKGNVIVQSDKSIAFIDFGEATEDMDRFDNNIFKCIKDEKKGGRKIKSKKNKGKNRTKKNRTKKQKR
jgi:serine/threonine protein kinase